MSTDVKQQAVFEKVFADDIMTAWGKLKTVEEKRAILLTIAWIVENRGKDSTFMLNSRANRGVEHIEERNYHNLFTMSQ